MCAGRSRAITLDFDRDVLALADAGFEQISVEPVVADASCDYALREEDLPVILDTYERLAAAYLRRRREGKWFNFFHFMIDLANGPCLAQAADRLWRGQRICGRYAAGRHLSLPSVRRARGVPDGQRDGRHV